MKRLNPETNQPFERGHKREDGRYFFQYTTTKVKIDGFFEERWSSKQTLDNYRNKQKEIKKIHAKNNPDKVNAKSNKRRAQKLERMPRWIKDVFIKEIKEYYTMAKKLEKIFSWKQHVDHIVPFKGKNVSGLHVPWNLQILSQKANQEKGNRHVEENTTTSVSEGHYHNGRVYTQFGTIPTTGPWEDGDNVNDHSGAIRGKDTDHSTQESGRDRVGHGGKEVGTPQPPQGVQDNGKPNSAYHWIED